MQLISPPFFRCIRLRGEVFSLDLVPPIPHVASNVPIRVDDSKQFRLYQP